MRSAASIGRARPSKLGQAGRVAELADLDLVAGSDTGDFYSRQALARLASFPGQEVPPDATGQRIDTTRPGASTRGCGGSSS